MSLVGNFQDFVVPCCEENTNMDMGPVEILYNWQAVLLAVGVAALVEGIKRAINVAAGGSDKRKAMRWVTEVVLPLLPLFAGSLGAILVPLHPDKLTEYVTAHPSVKPWVVYGAWGAAIGQFSDYLYQRAKSVMGAMAKGSEGPATPPPADPS